MSETSLVHVAVGIVESSNNEVLVSLRHSSLHQGGFWEFPGGKLDPGETVQEALCREFKEELGISPTQYFPFTKITHDYGDKSVLLDVWRITKFEGTPHGLEGQRVEWRPVSKLLPNDFPAGNRSILKLLSLPDLIPITPQFERCDDLLRQLESWIDEGHSIVYLRQPHLPQAEYSKWIASAAELCLSSNLKLIHSLSMQWDTQVCSPAGFHASSAVLANLNGRPCNSSDWFSASCHNLAELRQAERVGADFVFLSPVKSLEKYSNQRGLGWDGFSEQANGVNLAVYALGGIEKQELKIAREHGAFGIAGIRLFLR